jgi:hypothetical protein
MRSQISLPLPMAIRGCSVMMPCHHRSLPLAILVPSIYTEAHPKKSALCRTRPAASVQTTTEMKPNDCASKVRKLAQLIFANRLKRLRANRSCWLTTRNETRPPARRITAALRSAFVPHAAVHGRQMPAKAKAGQSSPNPNQCGTFGWLSG